MNEYPPELSIIIVNYNGLDFLPACLDSIRETGASLHYEVWIVDNGSIDGSVDLIRHHYPEMRLIVNDCNRGFAAANNQAIAVARGEYLLMLNNDTLVGPNALHSLLSAIRNDKTLAAVGPQLLNVDNTIQPSCMRFPTLPRLVRNYIGAQFGHDTGFIPNGEDGVTYVNAVSGACLLVRGKAIDSIGPLDEGYFMYAEETDWCYRAYKAGWNVGYVPNAKVVHLGGQTANREPIRFFIERRYSNVRFFLKHYGRRSARINLLFLRASLFVRWLINVGDRHRINQMRRQFEERMKPLFADADSELRSNHP